MAPNQVSKSAISQNKVFYSGEWTRAVEKKFVAELMAQASVENFEVGRPNHHAILSAMGAVNAHFGKSFDFKFCEGKTRKLHKRFQVFSWIKQQSGVTYTRRDNRLQAGEQTWEHIIRSEKLAMAYINEGENVLQELEYLFGDANDVGDGAEHVEVINISDDDEGDDNDDNENDSHVNRHLVIENESDNTNNCFHYDLAWYNSESASVSSIPDPEKPPKTLASTSEVLGKFKKHWATHEWDSDPIEEIPNSSTASSSSPFKK